MLLYNQFKGNNKIKKNKSEGEKKKKKLQSIQHRENGKNCRRIF